MATVRADALNNTVTLDPGAKVITQNLVSSVETTERTTLTQLAGGLQPLLNFSNIAPNGNILYVSSLNPNASDTLSRADALGRIDRPFVTIEAAELEAVPGDKIVMFGNGENVSYTNTGFITLVLFGSLGTVNIIDAGNVGVPNYRIESAQGEFAMINELKMTANGEMYITLKGLRINTFTNPYRNQIKFINCKIGTITDHGPTAGGQYIFENCRIDGILGLHGDSNTNSRILYARDTIFAGSISGIGIGFETLLESCHFFSPIILKKEQAGTTTFKDCTVIIDDIDGFLTCGQQVGTGTAQFIGGFYHLNTSVNTAAKIYKSSGVVNTTVIFDKVTTDVTEPFGSAPGGTYTEILGTNNTITQLRPIEDNSGLNDL